MASFQEPYDDDVVAQEIELPAVFPGRSAEDLGLGGGPGDDGPAGGGAGGHPGSADYGSISKFIPEPVKAFIYHFHQSMLDGSVYELHSIYENNFNKLTEKYYQKARWPEAEHVAHLVHNDHVFIILYRELYFRHVYSKLQPTVEDRFESYANYCDLFNFILNPADGRPVDLELPNQWLWDIIDEFIYQFQNFCTWRSKSKARTDDEMAMLKSRNDVWNVHNVLNVLYSLIQRSRINEQLLATKEATSTEDAAGDFGSRTLYKMLGYFSLVGLLRVHSLLGDYHLALSTLRNIELNKRGLFARLTACHVTTYYYVGYAYMAMRRYSDAIKAFAHILTFVQRIKQYHTRSYQYDAIMKKSQQMYALLAMCVTLSPQRIDDNVLAALTEQYGDQMRRMSATLPSSAMSSPETQEALATFEELYRFSCPKFVSPTPRMSPGSDASGNAHMDPMEHQLTVFLNDVKTHLFVPNLKSYLRLYSTLGVDKLARLLDLSGDEKKRLREEGGGDGDEEGGAGEAGAAPGPALTPEQATEECRRLLMVYKHKTRQRRWEKGEVLEGEWGMTSDLDFYLVKDMIHITETKTTRRATDWFVRNINKFEDIRANLELKNMSL